MDPGSLLPGPALAPRRLELSPWDPRVHSLPHMPLVSLAEPHPRLCPGVPWSPVDLVLISALPLASWDTLPPKQVRVSSVK